MRFKGKKALVTGAAGGIGKSVVRKLRAEGASVAITDITIGNVEAEAHFFGDLSAAQFCDELPGKARDCLLYTSPSPRDYAASRMPSSA